MITALAEANYGIAKGFLVGPGPVRKEPERPVCGLLSAFSILPMRLAFYHLALVTQADAELEGLLPQGSFGPLHLLRDLPDRRFRS